MALTAGSPSTDEHVIARLVWNTLCGTDRYSKHVLYATLFETLLDVEKLLASASVAFSPGLLDAVQLSTPPTVAFFKKLPVAVRKQWGVYLVVLEKSGHPSQIYIGSGTCARTGVIFRLQCYDREDNLPDKVQKALSAGWKIKHKGLLCSIPIPFSGRQPVLRGLFLALEATFTYVFWAYKNKEKAYGRSFSLCPWQPRDLEYGGLCGHNALKEGIVGDITASEEELEALAMQHRELSLDKKALDYHATKAKDPVAFNAKGAVNAKKWRDTHPGKHLDGVKRSQQKNLANGTFQCGPCNMSFPTLSKLPRHMIAPKLSTKHAAVMEKEYARLDHLARRTFYCKGCDKSFGDKSKLTRHMDAPKFKDIHDAMLKAEDRAPTSGEHTNDEEMEDDNDSL